MAESTHSYLDLTTFYHHHTIRLVESMVLKSFPTAVAMNEKVDTVFHSHGHPYRVDKNDFKGWRYYCHLAGEYHPYDEFVLGKPIEIRSLDTLQMIEFRKEVLVKHTATWKHYRARGVYYQQLIQQYPDFHLLIDGICRPIDKDKAIKAREWEILSYDESLIEPQEFYLIPQLQEQIHQAVRRFDSRNYTVYDKEYNPMKIAMLAMQLPGMIIALREQYVHTPYAHSYHIWNYLGSKFRLDRYRDVLTYDQVMWLYRHVRYLDINAGKESTFQQLVEHLLTQRGLPLYGFDIQKGIDTYQVDRHKINFLDKYIQLDEEDSVDKISERQNDLATRNLEFRKSGLDDLQMKLDRERLHTRPVKYLESLAQDFSGKEKYRLGTIALNYWVYLAFNGKYDRVTTMINPISGESLPIDPREGFILWLYLTIRVINPQLKDPDQLQIPLYMAYEILREKVDWEKIRKYLVRKEVKVNEGIDFMQQRYPVYEVIYSAENFAKFVREIQQYRLGNLDLEGTYGDLTLWGEIHHVNQYVLRNYPITLVEKPTTFGEYIYNKGWNLSKLTREQSMQLASQLYASFTGGDVKTHQTMSDVQKAMLQVMRILSSYSIQFNGEIRGERVTLMDINHFRVGMRSSTTRNIDEINHFFRLFDHHYGKSHNKLRLTQTRLAGDEVLVRGSERNDQVSLPDLKLTPVGFVKYRHEVMGNAVQFTRGAGSTPIISTPSPTYHLYQGTLYLLDHPSTQIRPFLLERRGYPVLAGRR